MPHPLFSTTSVAAHKVVITHNILLTEYWLLLRFVQRWTAYWLTFARNVRDWICIHRRNQPVSIHHSLSSQLDGLKVPGSISAMNHGYREQCPYNRNPHEFLAETVSQKAIPLFTKRRQPVPNTHTSKLLPFTGTPYPWLHSTRRE